MIQTILTQIDNVLYYPILLIILAAGGIYFSIRTKFAQIRLFPEAWKVIMEKPKDAKAVSSFQALMVSTASRVGTGNIIGVSTAICLGGPGAAFWMWIMAILGCASAFTETTLAQIFKKRDREHGGFHGGPAHYIEYLTKNKRFLATIFTIFMLLTYGFGFNLLCSYNLQSTFMSYSFYDPKITPAIIGLILAVAVGACIMGSGKQIVRVSEVIVPVMGLAYIAVALIIVFSHVALFPHVMKMILADAFNFRAIGSGFAGSCMVYGIKRGLYSNEAGVGSAPHAAASADVSHPCKQGLVAVVSVTIDTLFLCTATAFLGLASGVAPTKELAGAPFVQNALSASFGAFGPIFITIAMVLFAFTTLIGNLYYVNIGLKYLNHNKEPGKVFMNVFHIIMSIIIFAGALAPMEVCWALADITMGGMAIINIPTCIILGNLTFKALKDYDRQKKAGKDPAFQAASIDMEPGSLDAWD